MTIRTSLITLGLVAAVGLWDQAPATAAEITVLLNQATESGVRELAGGFEKATGHKVNVSFQGGPALNQKVNAGEGDLVSSGLAQINDWAKAGKIVPNSMVEYAQVGNGVAVKEGAPKPDISTPEAF